MGCVCRLEPVSARQLKSREPCAAAAAAAATCLPASNNTVQADDDEADTSKEQASSVAACFLPTRDRPSALVIVVGRRAGLAISDSAAASQTVSD